MQWPLVAGSPWLKSPLPSPCPKASQDLCLIPMTLRKDGTNSNGGTGKNVERDETREVEAFLPALSQHEVTDDG